MRLLGILAACAIIAAVLLLLSGAWVQSTDAAPRGTPDGMEPGSGSAASTASVQRPTLLGVPLRSGDDAERASHESFGLWVAPVPGPRGPALNAGSEEAHAASPAEFDLATGSGKLGGTPPSGSVGTAITGGWISWAEPDLGPDYLATRFPRGTLVQLCTPNRCIIRRSNDFGPSAAIDPPRIADLAVLDWESLCGLPRARGVCRGTVEAIDEIVLPATDTAR